MSPPVPTCKVQGPQRDGEGRGGFRIHPHSQRLTSPRWVIPTPVSA